MKKSTIHEAENIASFEKNWKNINDPGYFHKSEDWIDRYYKEFSLFFSGNRNAIVDAGCGAGDILRRMCKEFKTVYGIDFSTGMIQEAQAKLKKDHITNFALSQGSITDIKKFITHPVDVIFSNQVMQYLTVSQIEQFLLDCNDLLAKGGKILLMNIPNSNLRPALEMGIYHKQNKNSYSINDYLRYALVRSMKDVVRKAYKRKKYDLFGFWHSPKEIVETADRCGFHIEIFNSLYSPYGYRFHAVLSRKNDE